MFFGSITKQPDQKRFFLASIYDISRGGVSSLSFVPRKVILLPRGASKVCTPRKVSHKARPRGEARTLYRNDSTCFHADDGPAYADYGPAYADDVYADDAG